MTDIASILVDGQNVNMPALRTYLAGLERTITRASLATGLAIKSYATKSALDADTDEADGQLAYVYLNAGSPSDAANGYYQWKDGTSEWIAADWVEALFPAVGFASASEAQALELEDVAISPKTLKDAQRTIGNFGMPIPIGGNLPNGAPAFQGAWFISTPTVVSATRDELLDAGCTHVASVGASGTAFLIVTHDRPVIPGDWIIGSVILEKDNAASWPSDTSDIFYLGNPPVSGNQQSIAPSLGHLLFHEAIGTNMRRYVVAGQLGTASPFGGTAVTEPVLQSFFVVSNVTSATLKAGAFAMATSRRQMFDIDWRLFDPMNAGDLAARVDQLDGGVGVQNSPDLLAASSYFMVEGRPLDLFKARLTSFAEGSAFDVAAVGKNGTLPGVLWDDGRRLRLEAERLDGTGAMMAMKSRADVVQVFNRPVTFNTSAPSKSGTKRVLAIGDSLTYRGWVDALKAKMTEGGLTPQMIGTFPDIAGNLCEGRSSWHSQSYTYQQRAVNVDGSGQTLPVRTGAGSGVSFSVTRSGGVITGITASGGSGYDNVSALPLVIPDAGGGSGAFATVAISGGVPGTVTIVSGGSGYTSDPTVTMPPTVAEYLAMSTSPSDFGERWRYNPFIRPATGGDPSERVFNGYIFDLDFYLTRFSLADPDFVLIALGVNDILSAEPTANIMTALTVIYDQVRAALPGVPVAFCLPSLGVTAATGWTGVVNLLKSQIDQFGDREGEDLYLLPFCQAADPKLLFSLSVSATNAQGVQTATPTESIHPVNQGVAHSQWAEMAFAWVMCLS